MADQEALERYARLRAEFQQLVEEHEELEQARPIDIPEHLEYRARLPALIQRLREHIATIRSLKQRSSLKAPQVDSSIPSASRALVLLCYKRDILMACERRRRICLSLNASPRIWTGSPRRQGTPIVSVR